MKEMEETVPEIFMRLVANDPQFRLVPPSGKALILGGVRGATATPPEGQPSIPEPNIQPAPFHRR
jgi:hypothetical protein